MSFDEEEHNNAIPVSSRSQKMLENAQKVDTAMKGLSSSVRRRAPSSSDQYGGIENPQVPYQFLLLLISRPLSTKETELY